MADAPTTAPSGAAARAPRSLSAATARSSRSSLLLVFNLAVTPQFR